MELVQRFRAELRRKEFNKLDDTWLELLEAGAPLDKLLELIDLTDTYGPEGKSLTLLWVLSDDLKDRKRPLDQLSVLNRLLGRPGDETRLATEFADCYRRIYAGNEHIERLLQKAGLGYGQPLKHAVKTMESAVALLPGSWVYDAEYGPGKVEQMDFLLDKVTIQFRDGARPTLAKATTLRRFRGLSPDGFFTRLSRDFTGLRKLAAGDPSGLVVLLLRDVGSPMAVSEVKSGLAEVVPTNGWDSFWAKARPEVDRHAHVRLVSRPTRGYQWSDTAVEKKEVQPKPAKAKSGPTLADGELATKPAEEVARLFAALPGLAERKRVAQQLRSVRPDWTALFGRLILTSADPKTCSFLAAALKETDTALLDKALSEVLTGYRLHTEAFIWLAESPGYWPDNSGLPMLSRVVELLETSSRGRTANRLAAALTADEYRLIAAALPAVSEGAAASLLNRVKRLPQLEHYQVDEVTALFARTFPSLAAPKDEDVIYSTAAGIERGKKELLRLTQKELPKSAEDIARARAQGDLSENYEYKAAKEKQARLMKRISQLRADLAKARPIEPATVDATRVSVGTRVALEDASGESHEYAILGPWDSEHEKGIISYLAPLGKQLLGKKPGDTVEIEGQVHTVRKVTKAV